MYQPCVLDYNTAGYLILKSYEAWNPTTHVGTNLAYQSDGLTTAQRIDLVYGGDINIAVNQGLLLLMTRANSYWGASADQGPTWVCELTRVHPLDTVATGYPKWGWGSLNYLFSQVSSTPLRVPRTRYAATSAALVVADTDYGTAGNQGGVSVPGYMLMPQFNSSLSGKPWVSNLRIRGFSIYIYSAEVLGTIMGLLTITRTQGTHIGDEVSVTVSPDTGFAGQKFVDHAGATESWWLVGSIIGNQGRIAVEK